jgi:hypothetical protein
MFVHQGLVKGLRLYIYELSEMLYPTLNYEHTEWGYFRIDGIDVSPNPVDEEITKKLQDIRSTSSEGY